MNFVLGRVENIVGKGENVGYRHFLLFSRCFQNTSFSGLSKVGIVSERVIGPKLFENILGKEENAGNQPFSPLSTLFLPFPTQIPISESHLFCHLQLCRIWISLKFFCLVKG